MIYFSLEDGNPLNLSIAQCNSIGISVPGHGELDGHLRLLLDVDVELSVVPLVVSHVAPGQVQDLTLIPGGQILDGNGETGIEIWNILLGNDRGIVTHDID